MGRWDGELLESDFCDFAKKKRRMGSRDGELLELLPNNEEFLLSELIYITCVHTS
jgi:hypothetical protein